MSAARAPWREDGSVPLLLFSLAARVGEWLREGKERFDATSAALLNRPAPVEHAEAHQAPWYATLWLTGVDYFSSLGYAPGLAIAAAGFVAPVATLLLVLVTFAAALPVYAMVAKHSHEGEGSIKMIERLTLSWGRFGWLGKTLVLCLLGFAMTDFIITITLSAADATHHVLENPLLTGLLPDRPVLVTSLLIAALGMIFLKGFAEAIWLSVAIALPYMVLNAVIIGAGMVELRAQPDKVQAWWTQVSHFDLSSLTAQITPMNEDGVGLIGALSGRGVLVLAAACLLVFPKLALGMSGFETGVSVMPHITGADTAQRVSNTRKLMVAAAVLMSVELVGSSVVTTLLIPPQEFHTHLGKAEGRALAYLAHQLLGTGFGSVYDVFTVLILWFAGASAMAGLLNILPRYLPRFGMSPAWLEWRRPLVLTLTSICLIVNQLFYADVNQQGSAYATGVLVLMSSGAFAVFLAEKRLRWFFGVVMAVFLYVLVVNVTQRPTGLKIASFFIIAIVVASVWSRWLRASELRVQGVIYANDATREACERLKQSEYLVLLPLRDVGLEPRRRCAGRNLHHITDRPVQVVWLHVKLTEDTSQFSTPITLTVVEDAGDTILEIDGAVAVANAIAFAALQLEADEVVVGLLDQGTPVQNSLLYLIFGTGEVGYAVRAIFARLREEELEARMNERREFDAERDKEERELLRDAVLLSPEERQARFDELFAKEREKFASHVHIGRQLPRLILYD
jgi:hypothetical protein